MKGLLARRRERKLRLAQGLSRIETVIDEGKEEEGDIGDKLEDLPISPRSRRPTRSPSLRMLRRSCRMESYRQIHDWMTNSNDKLNGDDEDANELIAQARSMLEQYETTPLSNADKVIVMQGWNKVLAFKSMFLEALVLQWRLLCAKARQPQSSHSAYFPFRMVESSQDMLAVLAQKRDLEAIVFGLLDGAIRRLCPHTQLVAREAYRPVADEIRLLHACDPNAILHEDCESVEDYMQLLARLGVPPSAWVHFVGALAWAWDTHVPYAKEEDKEDLELGAESAVLRAVTQMVAVPAMQAWKELRDFGSSHSSTAMRTFWRRLEQGDRAAIGERIYRKLFDDHPDLLDFFSKTDMDSLSLHLIQALGVIIKSSGKITAEKGPFRSMMNHLGRIHLDLGVPSYAYPLVGHSIISCLDPYFHEEEKRTLHTDAPVKAEVLKKHFTRVYSEVMSLVYYPIVHQEKLIKEAREFYDKVKVELGWTDGVFAKRMSEIEQEIVATGTYTQTLDEIQTGARLAWRNSAKCIGRISWNTLLVRDCRHITQPEDVFQEVEEHLKIATAGTNIQSVMTIFRPLRAGESIGPRFWTEQFVRYAGYRDEDVSVGSSLFLVVRLLFYFYLFTAAG